MSIEEIKQKKNWIKEINKAINYKTLWREEIARSWYFDYDSMSEKEVLAKLKSTKQKLIEEVNFTSELNKFFSILANLRDSENLTIYCFGDYVDDTHKIGFISSFFSYQTSADLKKLNETLLKVERLHCQIKDRYAKNWRVYYSGEIIDENKIVICKFSEIDNGFAVNLG